MSILLQYEMVDLLTLEAGFFETLPSLSKQHIWSHAVKSRDLNGERKVWDETQNIRNIERLMCDCTIVYIKYLDRSNATLVTHDIRPYFMDISQYMFDNNHPINQQKFVEEKGYFSSLLKEYAEVLRGVQSRNMFERSTLL